MPTPPYDPTAELAVLQALATNREDAERVMASIVVPDFYLPAHARLFDVLSQLREHGEPPDLSAVRSALARTNGHTTIDDDTLRSLFGGVVMAVGAHIDAVQAAAARRRVIAEAARTIDLAYDTTQPAAEMQRLADRVADAASLTASNVQPGPDIDTWLAAASSEYDDLVTGMLERRHRVLLTGWMEAGGKTIMMRQMAVQAAAGIVWYTADTPMPPCRVLFVDCENPEGISRRSFRSLRNSAGERLDPHRLVVLLREEGLDLLTHRDRRWLAGVVEANRPDLLIIGPLYKMTLADENDGPAARALSSYLDLLRKRYDIALVIESHTPHEQQGKARTLRPIGHSTWRRWAEWGLGITMRDDQYRLVQWKPRDDRDWPHELYRGDRGRG